MITGVFHLDNGVGTPAINEGSWSMLAAMKHTTVALALVMACAVQARAADGISGTWMTDSTSSPQTFIFKVRQDAFFGLVCGPCDDPGSVFRIEDGRILEGGRVTFVVRYDRETPSSTTGPARRPLHRARVTGTLSGGRLTLVTEPAGGAGRAAITVLRRVVENGVSVAPKTWTLTRAGSSASSPSSGIEGRWVANGRVAQQNFVLKVEGSTLWGLVCGPCDPDVVALIDDGRIDGETIVFYINHIDTPPSPTQTSLRRNIMRGTISGNVMKFTWVREGAEQLPGGEMVLIGPIR
jgi:hypothetical protein